MNENPTPAQDVSRLSPAAYRLSAARRWADEQFGGAASTANWTTRQVLEFVAEHHVLGLEAFRAFRFYETYQQASPEAQATVDAVFQAVEDKATPYVGVSLHRDGQVGASFSLPTADPDNPASYVVDIDPLGRLARLRKWVLTGRWIDNGDGELDPAGSWVTVSRFSQDPAGKLFKHSRAIAYALQTGPWMDAVTR